MEMFVYNIAAQIISISLQQWETQKKPRFRRNSFPSGRSTVSPRPVVWGRSTVSPRPVVWGRSSLLPMFGTSSINITAEYTSLTSTKSHLGNRLPSARLPSARLPSARLPSARLPSARLPSGVCRSGAHSHPSKAKASKRSDWIH